MRLKKYTPDTVGKQKRGKAFVKMAINGVISFSAQATEMIGLEKEGMIEYMMYGVEVDFIKGRLKFGNGENSAPFPSMVVVFKNKI